MSCSIRIAALLAALIVILAFATEGQTKRSPNKRATARTLATQTVAYCDLVKNPGRYRRKVLRVEATYTASFEGSIMGDEGCSGKYTWVDFDDRYQRATPHDVLKAFDTATDTSSVPTMDGGILFPSGTVRVIWIGRFDGPKQAFDEDSD